MTESLANGADQLQNGSETNRESLNSQIVQLLGNQLNRADFLLRDISISLGAYVAWQADTLATLAQLLGEGHECVRQFRLASGLQDLSNEDDSHIGMCLNNQMSMLERIIRQIEANPSMGLSAISVYDRSYPTEATGHEIQAGDGTSQSVGKQVQIFLSYSRSDKTRVEALYKDLKRAGYKPWMDVKDILGGEDWEIAIERSIRASDFFFACLSRNSYDKRGWIQKEIGRALDIRQEKLPDDIYIIPIKLEICEVPDRLKRFQVIELFEKNGWNILNESLRMGVRRQKRKSNWKS